MPDILNQLLNSQHPAIRYKAQVNIQGKDPDSSALKKLRGEIKASAQAAGLLSERNKKGQIPHGAYSKWRGAHWVLAALADLDYPPGDQSLIPLREQVLAYLFDEEHTKYFQKRTVAGKVRMHPSIEGNAIYAMLKLGLPEPRMHQLVEWILSWRWPDGGWNCDMNPETTISSYHETLIPLRALAHYQRHTGDKGLTPVIEEVADVFLRRKLFKRLRDSKVMNPDFVALFYPPYWHYNFLFGLKALHEAGFLGDPRCQDALDLLESKRLPDGGFPAEKKYYQSPSSSTVDWGGASKRNMNEWVTAEALAMLKAAGR
jgi:hypothetical protein